MSTSLNNPSAGLASQYDEDDPRADQLLESLSHLRIPKDRLQFDEPRQIAGQGGFGVVERALLHGSGDSPTVVAVKRIPGRVISFQRLKKRTGREILVWSSLTHPGVVPFLGYEWDETAVEVWLVCPWQDRGTIRDYLSTSLVGIEQRIKLIVRTAEAIEYLHTLNPPICHGDIKAANVLISESEDPMLTDFGLSRMLDNSLEQLETTKQFQGSIRWCSPELLKEDRYPREPPCDVWAWAWLVIEIVTGKIPFDKVPTPPMVVIHILQRKWVDSPPDSTFNDLSDLWRILLLCWTEDPNLRTKMTDCLSSLNTVKPPSKYTVPEESAESRTQSPQTPEPDVESSAQMVASGCESSDTESSTFGEDSTSGNAGTLTHREVDGLLAPPSGPGVRPARSPGAMGATQEFLTNADLRDTGSPRNLTKVLSKESWGKLKKKEKLSSMYEASLLPDSHAVAIVCVSRAYRTKPARVAFRKQLKHKLKQQRLVTSPNVAHWVGFGFVSTRNYACLVRHQDSAAVRLPAYLESNPSTDRLDVVKQVASGLGCLHSNKIVHGDLHTATLVATPTGTIQLAGFGLVDLLGISPEDLFTIRFSPLEVLQGSSPTTASDVYSFAHVALEIFTGLRPFVKVERDTTVIGALHKGTHPKADSYPDFPHKETLWNLFKRCWEADPTKRPNMNEINETLLQIS